MLFAKHQLDELGQGDCPALGEQLMWDAAAGPLQWH